MMTHRQIQLIGSIVLGGSALSTASTTLFQAAILTIMMVQLYLLIQTESRQPSKSCEPSSSSKPLQLEVPRIKEYAQATVCFADIAGFTHWSATHSPLEVVSLLGRLFSEFDTLAARHGIYKVETIGDCYLCMTGAPVDDPHHALHMGRFALDLQQAAHNILPTSLQLRVGLHSGPLAAGLFGQRFHQPRFQIFGDTVNTASRVESLGRPGCIHVSEATATLLQDHDEMATLLQRRDDRVYAKGKGHLQTYWLKDSASLPLETTTPLSNNNEECKTQDEEEQQVSTTDVTVLYTLQKLVELTPDVPRPQLARSCSVEASCVYQTPPLPRIIFQSPSGY